MAEEKKTASINEKMLELKIKNGVVHYNTRLLMFVDPIIFLSVITVIFKLLKCIVSLTCHRISRIRMAP